MEKKGSQCSGQASPVQDVGDEFSQIRLSKGLPSTGGNRRRKGQFWSAPGALGEMRSTPYPSKSWKSGPARGFWVEFVWGQKGEKVTVDLMGLVEEGKTQIEEKGAEGERGWAGVRLICGERAWGSPRG